MTAPSDPLTAVTAAEAALAGLLEQRERALDGMDRAPDPAVIERAEAALADARFRVLGRAYVEAAQVAQDAMEFEFMVRAALPSATQAELVAAFEAYNDLLSVTVRLALRDCPWAPPPAANDDGIVD